MSLEPLAVDVALVLDEWHHAHTELEEAQEYLLIHRVGAPPRENAAQTLKTPPRRRRFVSNNLGLILCTHEKPRFAGRAGED